MSMLQANQRHVPGGARHGTASIRVGWIAIVLLALILAACGTDDSGDRQFANDPKTPQPTATETSGSPGVAAPVAPRPAPASPETLVDRRGAPETAYWLHDGALWAIGAVPPHQVANGVLAYAPAPDGTRVAVLVNDESNAGSTYRIDIHDRDGAVERTFDDVLLPAVAATPSTAPADVGPSVSLDWSPQGNRLLLATGSGALIDVPFDGEIREIETRTQLTGLVRADWSPRGDVIAALTRDEHDNGSLALIDPATEPAQVSVIAPVGRPDEGVKSVEAFEWKPRGDGVLFIQARRSGEHAAGGMIVSWDRSTNSTQVMATGGQGGPSGAVTSLSVAPDGKAVAYIVSVPSGDDWSFIGLFVRSLVDGQLYRVPVDADASVTQTWWLRDGLAWGAEVGDPSEATEVQFRYVDGLGDRVDLGAIGAAPGATPAASPMPSTPAASPVVASPGASLVPATPVSSPAATPAASPAVASPAASPVVPAG
jgi:hypothetical protein